MSLLVTPLLELKFGLVERGQATEVTKEGRGDDEVADGRAEDD